MSNNFKIKAAEFVEVAVPAGNTKQIIFFPDLPNIRSKQIEGIEVFSALELSKSIAGNTTVADTNLKDVVLTLYYEGGEYTVIPLESIHRIVNKANQTTFGDIPALAGQKIDWTKCYVTIVDTANLANFAGKSFIFNVYYIKN